MFVIIKSTGIIVNMTSKPDEINNKICLKIKMERTKRHWSQEQLSE